MKLGQFEKQPSLSISNYPGFTVYWKKSMLYFQWKNENKFETNLLANEKSLYSTKKENIFLTAIILELNRSFVIC